jgi:glycosyltransferase involved in cell wall biosynthesis
MRILVATDAWRPQVNGVVRSLEALADEAERMGVRMDFLTPEAFRTVPMPSYPEIRLAMPSPRRVQRTIERLNPTHIHIATEGPIGWRTRRYCLKNAIPFTSSYHTRFPEYLRARAPVPERWSYAFVRRFHNAGAGIMVATSSLERDLAKRGFRNIMRWSRGVDITRFYPRPGADLGLPRPIFLNVGRVAVEKNLEAFLALDLPGSKVVVGDGPALAEYRARYPAVHFLGAQTGETLATTYAAADVFVFPSLTDTFGLVLIEALASGLPVAAFPVMGPVDVLDGAPVGRLDGDLRAACLAALDIDRARCIDHGRAFTWEASTRQFLANVEDAARRGLPAD